LNRAYGVRSGVYVSAVVGAGVLVLPGQAAGLAGTASLLAWGFSCLLGVSFATTFAGAGDPVGAENVIRGLRPAL
jgi:amino acid transporter